jgi:hypothetical protein
LDQNSERNYAISAGEEKSYSSYDDVVALLSIQVQQHLIDQLFLALFAGGAQVFQVLAQMQL